MAEHLTLAIAIILFGIFEFCFFLGLTSAMMQLKKKIDVLDSTLINFIHSRAQRDVKLCEQEVLFTDLSTKLDKIVLREELVAIVQGANHQQTDKIVLPLHNMKLNLDIIAKYAREANETVYITRKKLEEILEKTKEPNKTDFAVIHKQLCNIRQILTNLTFTEVLGGGVPIENVIAEPPKVIPDPVIKPQLKIWPKKVSPENHGPSGRRRKATEADFREIRKRLIAGQSTNFVRSEMGFGKSTWDRVFRQAKATGKHDWWKSIKDLKK